MKTLFREAIKGKVSAAILLIHTFEGTPGQRMQCENVPGTALRVERKVEVNAEDLVETIRQIYGLPEDLEQEEKAVKPGVM